MSRLATPAESKSLTISASTSSRVNEWAWWVTRAAANQTPVALMQFFYHVDAGRILIDGHDIARATEASLRNAIAIVPQDTALLNRTLLENIRYGRPDATDEEVWDAAAAARCRPFIENLPRGLDTMVGDRRRVKLSGGQRQRIAIARAFLKDAPLLILDEATSALDIEAEEAIRETLESLMAGRTVITIAHRLSTLRNFDRILVLQGGRLVEDRVAGRPHARPRRLSRPRQSRTQPACRTALCAKDVETRRPPRVYPRG